MNKLSLVGMQLPENIYRESFDASSEAPSSGVTSGGRENYMSFYTKNIKAIMHVTKNKPIRWIGLRSKRRNSPYIFSGNCIPTNESLFILLALPTLAQTVQDYIS